MIAVEVCIETIQDLAAARAGGAHRLEICSSLDIGGLTPSAGFMRLAARTGIAARALIRPRPGSFVYDADDLQVMSDDIKAAQSSGLAGVVIGATARDRRLDRDALARLVDVSKTMGRTLHRAFDVTPDAFESLELAIDLGFDRILTSGQERSALDGAARLSALVEAARGRIVILAGGGITAGNVGTLLRTAGMSEVHASCRRPDDPAEAGSFEAFGFGRMPRGVDASRVRDLVNAVNRSDVPERIA